jgi:hypothetical protein
MRQVTLGLLLVLVVPPLVRLVVLRVVRLLHHRFVLWLLLLQVFLLGFANLFD